MDNIPMYTNVVKLYGEKGLLNERRKYNVPEYQRDYSWGEKELKSFEASVNRAINGEKVFMGTVQFSKESADEDAYDIVDGQQRMTTFILLLKALGEDVTSTFNGCFTIKNFDCNAQKLSKALDTSEENRYTDNSDAPKENRYAENMQYLESFADSVEKDYGIPKAEALNNVFKNIYFVELITTGMGLPEVVSIFKTINTTGLDLNDTDIFKLHYYEYLHKQDKNRPWMSEISKIYEDINNTEFCSMNNVLDMYKLCLVAKYNLKWEKLSMPNEAFFKKFFKEILTGKDNEKYSELLNFEEFTKMVALYKDFQTMLCRPKDAMELINALKNKIDYFATNLIYNTRYGWRYWMLPFVIAFFDDEKNRIKKYANALSKSTEVAKYLIVCSVNYDKVINPVHTFMCSKILEKIGENEDISQIVSENIKESPYEWERTKHPQLNKNEFIVRIKKGLFYKRTRSFIICRLSALLDEINANSDFSEISAKLFNWKDKHSRYDIEHICSKAFFEEKDRENIDVYNGIGNLVVFEQDKNRRVKDQSQGKSVEYPKSKYVSVRLIADKKPNLNWTLDDVHERVEEETRKLCSFLGLDDNSQA